MMARELLSGPGPDDIMVHDFVTVGGRGPVGWVKRIDGDHATVAFDEGHREILPLAVLLRCKQRGSLYDQRGIG